MEWSRDPTSRRVVKPASKLCRAAWLDLSNVRAGVSWAIAPTTSGSPPRQRWTWQSIKPGNSVSPRPSILFVPRGREMSRSDPTAAMVAPRMTTVARSIVRPVPSMTRTERMARGFIMARRLTSEDLSLEPSPEERAPAACDRPTSGRRISTRPWRERQRPRQRSSRVTVCSSCDRSPHGQGFLRP